MPPTPDTTPRLRAPATVHAPSFALTAVGVAVLAWLAVVLDGAGQLAAALVVFASAGVWVASVALQRVRYRRFVERPLAVMVSAMDRCAFDLRAARCGEQELHELQALAQAIDAMLDRLALAQGRSRATLSAVQDAIFTINHRGVIQSCNPAASQMFGYAESAMIGRNVGMLMGDPDRSRHDGYIRRYVESGVARILGFPREAQAVRADGSTFPISLLAKRIDDELGQPSFCGIIRDITEQQRSQRELAHHANEIEHKNLQLRQAKLEAESANRSKSEFLASMSHEIRTPMTAILGFAEDLRDESLPADERAQAIETVLRNGEHLMVLINDILDLSKIEAGRLTIERIEFSPVELVGEVASLIRARARSKGIELEVDLDGPLPTRIQSDPTRLRQVLINLCGNAVKFTSTGSVRIAVRLPDATRPRLRFAVKDTGIGLDADQQARLFLPFEQAEQSTARRFGGSGLGLHISQRLVELLGGRIRVESAPGRGSTFSFEVATGPLDGVPMTTDAKAALAAAQKPQRAESLPQLCGHVLLAEDGADNQRLIRAILEKAGARVTVVGDGRTAVDAVTGRGEDPFDLILMDMQMPVMDGYEATSTLRRGGFEKPIVALTANAMAGDRERCLAAGCTDFEPKPVNRKALLATLARLLGDRT